jgi:hypothetical protein
LILFTDIQIEIYLQISEIMPLPAALQARLAQRGLLQKEKREEKDQDEEVFAESYDDPEETDSNVN